MTKELLDPKVARPCADCGAQAVLLRAGGVLPWFIVGCPGCERPGVSHTCRSAAVEAWNRSNAVKLPSQPGRA